MWNSQDSLEVLLKKFKCRFVHTNLEKRTAQFVDGQFFLSFSVVRSAFVNYNLLLVVYLVPPDI